MVRNRFHNKLHNFRKSFDKNKMKLKKAGLSIKYNNGKEKELKLKYSKAKDKDFKDIEIDAHGLLAKALCHEIDHLDGVVFTDIMIEEDKD